MKCSWLVGVSILVVPLMVGGANAQPAECYGFGPHVCYRETTTGDGTCRDDYRSTEVWHTEIPMVNAPVALRGAYSCEETPQGPYTSHGATVWVGPAYFSWRERIWEGETECFLVLAAYEQRSLPCPASPPDPGWGTLLP